ncbi:hypothetical protein [Consotaella salsifontis]|uniref:Uncharacterized protein n=1 Tax=Consotaella salsifontis TaxID=1365950 RepID=A0A1T4RDW4_9HYPH|nr:hypothetical protein [Consotaella salsifontis]SKA14220.1 hypothetical protein SAMN05428963_106243 [Consotaella salsifontis]
MDRTDEPETPLDPAAEILRRRMVRLLAVSIGVMAVGFMTVVGVIVYRATRPVEAPAFAAKGEPFAVDLPAGTVVRDVSLDGDRALLHVGGEGGEGMILMDLSTGAVLARYAFPGR